MGEVNITRSETSPLIGRASVESKKLTERIDSSENVGNLIVPGEKSVAHERVISNEKSSFGIRGWTTPMRELYRSNEGIGKAAYLLRDVIVLDDSSIFGFQSYNPFTTREKGHPSINKLSIFSSLILSKFWYRSIVEISVLIMLLLSFIEPPDWCASSLSHELCYEKFHTKGPVKLTVSDNDSEEDFYYPSIQQLLLVTTEESRFIELTCLFVLCIHTALMIGRDGMSLTRYLDPNGKTRVVRIFQFCAIFLNLANLILNLLDDVERYMYQILRLIIFVTFSAGVQREIITVMKLIPEIISTFWVLLITVTFYAWIGVIMFKDTTEGSMCFPTLVEGMWTLYIMITTANYPDVMMPAYNQNSIMAIYFISFMIISYYFLMNVILGQILNKYALNNDLLEDESSKAKKKGLEEAFVLLGPKVDSSGVAAVDYKTVMAIFLILNEDCPEVKYIDDKTAELIFSVLDNDGSDRVSLDEFMEFGYIMMFKFQSADIYITFMEQNFPGIYRTTWFQGLSNILESEKFEVGIEIILVLNAVVVGIQSYPELVGLDAKENSAISNGEIDTIWETFETIFTVIYVAEATLKILVQGWNKYSADVRNIFDFVITIMSIAATAYVYYPNGYYDSRLVRYIVMARVLRLVRLLVSFKSFQLIGKTLRNIIPDASRVFLFLLCMMYAFSAIGMYAFGGMISRDPNNPLSNELYGTDFAENHYWGNNFNCMMSGMNVCFDLLVINNWTIMSDGIVAVTGSKYSRFFFVVFHILGVIIVNNVVVAFVINSFITEWQQENSQTRSSKGGVVAGEGNAMLFDASEVTGTSTSLTGNYVVKVDRHFSGRKEKLR